MVAYSFQARFAQPILDGTKGGTIRAQRKRHARPGETLQLYTGMRTRHCRLIAREICLAAENVTLHFVRREVVLGFGKGRVRQIKDVDRFAQFDGFDNWRAMAGFWIEGCGTDAEGFNGVSIRWLDLPEGLD